MKHDDTAELSDAQVNMCSQAYEMHQQCRPHMQVKICVPANISLPIAFCTSSGIPAMSSCHSSLLISWTILSSSKASAFSVAVLLLERICFRRDERSISSLPGRQQIKASFHCQLGKTMGKSFATGASDLAHYLQQEYLANAQTTCLRITCHKRNGLVILQNQAYQTRGHQSSPRKAVLPRLYLHWTCEVACQWLGRCQSVTCRSARLPSPCKTAALATMN